MVGICYIRPWRQGWQIVAPQVGRGRGGVLVASLALRPKPEQLPGNNPNHARLGYVGVLHGR